MIVVASGQILFIGSLLFGSDKYNEVLAKHLSVSVEEAEKTKKTALLNSGDTESPLFQCTQLLENELRSAVEHWRSQERPEIGNKMFSHVWLCGGGSQLRGIDRYFGRTYGCPCDRFGPEKNGEVLPGDVTAYGLALQGLGQAHVPLSLCPVEVSWLRQRENLFGYLFAAAAAIAVLLGLLLLKEYRQLIKEEEYVKERIEELQRSEALIPQLEDVRASIRHYEKMLIPLVAKGNRTKRFLVATEQLAAAHDENDWFIYLADDVSYQAGKGESERRKNQNRQKETDSRATTTGPAFGIFGGGPAIGDTEPVIPYVSEKVLVEDLPPLRSMIVAGYTSFLPDRVYVPVREIVGKLNDSELFAGVDLLAEPERVGREDIFDPWLRFFRKWPTRQYKAYTLRLPLAELDVKVLSTSKEEK